MIDLAICADPAVSVLLARHPRVSRTETGDVAGIIFYQGSWRREVRVGDATAEQFGLVELMDNNPVVCADTVSVPAPVSTLALIAVGPVAWASLVQETPSVISSHAVDGGELSSFLTSAGWDGGANLHVEPVDLDGVVAITAMVEIRTPDDLDDIDALYEERFGRSFFVRRDEDSVWDPSLVRGTPYAVYRLLLAPDAPNSLLTIRVLADLKGKAGASQMVHAMNVMAGFEETLGIA
ncbi:hypothetical protein [Fimbriimonas ginsengisoli]|uniref:N-acetyl-gamma-glutamyl-phosphate reductase n=1 Tax=Fimbriimonas ginsengisoli Gsoil 348 TaxID=661478 RepID=A0A068NVB5_FIMGI|nr:hypothetical protein [Fimbriimonas ginsengisoli]AIE87391.1 N-acetyl-gamma-glutamyl-phosphate reductase [Fimbriimonas ginsengisoli Gsoil 348]